MLIQGYNSVSMSIDWGFSENWFAFADLPRHLQYYAMAKFYDAGPGDGHAYLVLCDGTLLCRRKVTKKLDNLSAL